MRSKEEIQRDLDTQTKVCYDCKNRLPFTFFCDDSGSPDNKKRICRDCVSKGRSRKRTLQRTREEIANDISTESKVCSICLERKQFQEFRKQKSVDGRYFICIACAFKQRQERNVRKYGIDEEKYKEILENQGGVCAICGKTPFNKRRMGVDHNHKTGKVRGVLCGTCNSGIAMLGEDKSTLLKAIEYLEFHEE